MLVWEQNVAFEHVFNDFVLVTNHYKQNTDEMIKIAILDFDGTLGDTTALIVRTTQAAIRELGLPERSDEQCAAMIGLRLVEIPPVLFPELEVDRELYAATYRRIFNEFNTEGAVQLYPHVMETLKELKRRGIILTTAGRSASAAIRATDTFLSAFFGSINIPAGNAQNHQDHSNDYKINRFHNLLLSA